MWLTLLFLIISASVLVVAGMRLVKSLTKISQFLRITEFTAAFIIMAIATSLPELFVAIMSASQQIPALSLGNVIGANILDITLVVGVIVLLGRGVQVRTKQTKKDSFWAVGILAIPLLLFLIEGHISRIGGAILVALFVFYSWRLIRAREKYRKPLEDMVKRRQIVTESALFVILLIILFFSSQFVVHYASLLSIDLGLAPLMIGLFILAIGTVLPELTFGSAAAVRGAGEMALGDQIGTIIVNSTLVIGIAALIYPITAHITSFMLSAIFMLLAAFIFATLISSGRKLDTTEGITLILLYVFFVFVEFYTKGLI